MKREHKIVAITYNKQGRELARAANNYRKSHPIQAHFAKLAAQPDRIYLHAEIAALLKSGDERPHRIWIERTGADGKRRLAAPCKVCQLALKHWGVKVIEYSA